jgi:undecaprenyl-diphosphatase
MPRATAARRLFHARRDPGEGFRMTHLTYLQAAVVGLVQGVTELFPVSSLGHGVLIPALLGGQWATNLNLAATDSPYLAFIVGLHVATAAALLVYFWRDWVRIIGGLFTSIRYREVATADEKLAWMIVLGTIPVGIAGVALQKTFQTVFGQPRYAAVFLALNGVILIAGERFRRRSSLDADDDAAWEREKAELVVVGRHSAGARGQRQRERAVVATADRRLAGLSYPHAVLIGSAQILALLAGISRDGVTMVAGMVRGLSREDAARFAFLLATPAILAAGVLKLPELFGPLGKGIHGQILLGSILAGAGAYLSVRFLVRYLRTRTLTPFGVYCLVAGLASLAYLSLIKR